MINTSAMLEIGKRHVNEERQHYEDRIAQLVKRLSRVRQLVNDPGLMREHPDQTRLLIKSALVGYVDIEKREPIK